MRSAAILSVLVLALVSAGVPASAQYSGGFGKVPGVLVNRVLTLARPVDVTLQGVAVQDAAQALTQASGVPIVVDPQVGTGTRVSLAAHGVPLGMLLEAVARQTNLALAPLPHAVRLALPPALSINGQPAPLAASFAPWTNDWGLNPAIGLFDLGGWSGRARPGAENPG